MRHGAAFTAFFDANVLYPFQLRDLIMRLAVTDLFRARWSHDVHLEWMAAVRANHPDISAERLEKTRRLMDEHARDALVTGYEFLIPTLALPDPKDTHVLAAAIHGRADVIVTSNLRHFPAEMLHAHSIHAEHPDQFIAHLIDLEPAAVVGAAREACAALQNPSRSIDEYLQHLERAGLPLSVGLLRRFAPLMQ